MDAVILSAKCAIPAVPRTDKHMLGGVTYVNGVPTAKRVVVIDRLNMIFVAATISHPTTGEWKVYGLPVYPDRTLIAISFDDTGVYNAEVADLLTQVEMVF